MSSRARLLSVRLQGFKSFAERSQVTFGPGISAVVGPNGSGKSNLADALRWALGEQGRALRTRKAEDVIWAGSERRPAVGMADVQIVLDNSDGLLPVEFGVVEVGRRLFRSGENEYVLNRERVRLRDVVDLLDAAHLAENAFLFIGQGTVDQALALRPEERRPLFEEVAGVRRHDRRRRRAEEQLGEATANLTRVEDLLAELRPQVRRLAAQAEQQASRRDAGAELAEALVVSGHARWHQAATRLSGARRDLAELQSVIAADRTALRALEAAAAGGSERLAATAAVVDAARVEQDAARELLLSARIEAASAAAEVDAIDRERSRTAALLEAQGTALAADRRSRAVTVPVVDPALEQEAVAARRAHDDAARALAEARSASRTAAEEREAAVRADARRSADIDQARRRARELARERAEANEAASAAAAALDGALVAHADARAALDAAAARAALAERAEAASAAAVRSAEAALDAALRDAASGAARLAAAEARLAAARERLESLAGGALAAAARGAGGEALLDGVVLDEALRAAAAAVLGDLAGAYVVGRDAATGLADQRGSVIVREALPSGAPAATPAGAMDPGATAVLAAARAAGGGSLLEAIRDDPAGRVGRLLAAAVWVPDARAALDLQARLPGGWLAVTRDGRAIVRGPALTLGRTDGPIELAAAAAALEADVVDRHRASEALEATVADRRAQLERSLHDLGLATAEREAAADARSAVESASHATARRVEATTREASWLGAQAERTRAAVERAEATLAGLEPTEPRPADAAAVAAATPEDAFATLERRVATLGAVRDGAEDAWRRAEAARRDAERDRARVDAAIALGEQRLAELDATLAELTARSIAGGRRATAAASAVDRASGAAAAAERRLDVALGEDRAARAASGGAEREAATAREALRGREERGRAIEREELEARLSLEAVREGLLVELAGLGEVGLRHLRVAGAEAQDREGPPQDLDEVAAFEAALEAAGQSWAAEPPAVEAPTAARIGALRRRFHELGSANPFAVEEHAELSARLGAMEGQRADLIAAVERTRALITELDELMARQFRETFGALERAFDDRFRQLFGGGFARLSLTDPTDLATTGIEITARPPGKKPQALAMLSGGERALTAVALLFAMLEVRPVPFCVLDEVDAALDEANVGRFSDALRELGRTTQVVVITHNRGTIETADALYGVTVGDDSVSRVISLRLEEATAIADRAAGRDASGADVGATPPLPRDPILPAGLAELPVESAG